ncbi:fimbrial protein [Buttiauxella izardii]|uniref:Ferrous iron transporter B n=1 Tax=Buttiauxella izardii TaxID=82991 RepID=A0A3A5JNG8_9ENTR|nr:fimbrial protein [Buttiauxella izardii]RJT20060.1 ferrous iron transporter B [Buttiauxella izardii]
MKYLKYLFCATLLIIMILHSQHAHAACTSPDIPNQAVMNSISVSSTLPVGQIIPGTDHLFTISGSCSSGHNNNVIIGCYYGSGNAVAGFPGVYDTGVAGIGITLINEQGQRIVGTGQSCDTRGTPLGYVSTDGKDTFNFTATIALVKTSVNISSGSLQQAQTKFGVGVYGRDAIGNPNQLSYAGNINFKAVTCNVPTKALSVDLGSPFAGDFPGVGSTTLAKTFIVPVTCNDPVEIGTELSSGNGYELPDIGVVKLTQESGVATGVGVQFLYNGSPLVVNNYITTGNITVADETINIPFDVRYYQTASTVTPGAANAVATLSISYH